jgi:hypothetical protein
MYLLKARSKDSSRNEEEVDLVTAPHPAPLECRRHQLFRTLHACMCELLQAGGKNSGSDEEEVSLMTVPTPPAAAAAPAGTLSGPLMSQPSAGNAPAANRQPGSSSSSHYVPGYPLLSSTAASFLAGLLDHLPGLLPFTCPTENSYARLKPGTWAGAVTCWGWDNR